MSEYWKSVPRKFCDFCKCWITDNKPSVEFHERGKRHQENVELRLKEVRKKSLKQTAEDEETKKQMDQMEQAALEAFKKDLKNNPELAAQYGVSLEPKPAEVSAASTEPKEKSEQRKRIKKLKKKAWREAKSPADYSYYWHIKTGESRWEAPEDFLSLAEQEEIEQFEKEKEKEAEKEKIDSRPKQVTQEKPKVETKAAETIEEAAKPRVDPTHSRSAYGSWSVVREEAQPTVYDETSAPPSLEEIPLPVPASLQSDNQEREPKEKKPKFREKTITSLGSSTAPVAFKKRKIAGGARNLRQKGDDD